MSILPSLFYQNYTAAKESNTVLSPLSIHVVLSLIATGSKGQTLDQLLSFLKSNSTDDLNSLSSQLVSRLTYGSATGWPYLILCELVEFGEMGIALNLESNDVDVVLMGGELECGSTSSGLGGGEGDVVGVVSVSEKEGVNMDLVEQLTSLLRIPSENALALFMLF
ncbi:hypothetical protein LguiB_003634 [Lonicera macranthoides]